MNKKYKLTLDDLVAEMQETAACLTAACDGDDHYTEYAVNGKPVDPETYWTTRLIYNVALMFIKHPVQTYKTFWRR